MPEHELSRAELLAEVAALRAEVTQLHAQRAAIVRFLLHEVGKGLRMNTVCTVGYTRRLRQCLEEDADPKLHTLVTSLSDLAEKRMLPLVDALLCSQDEFYAAVLAEILPLEVRGQTLDYGACEAFLARLQRLHREYLSDNPPPE